jgi:hypothetical protein
MSKMSTVPAVLDSQSSHNTSKVVDKVANFIRRFVFLKDDSLYFLLALWVIHTYLIDEFEYTGYVFANSPEPESGKTRLLEVLEILIENSSGLLVSPSESVLFRTAKGQTQFLDEVDTWTNRDALRGVLNAGYQHNGQIPRMTEVSGKRKDYEVQLFPVFAPRALSGIGLQILPAATRSRTFAIAMVRRTATERGEKFRRRKLKPQAQQLMVEIKSWVVQHKAAVAVRYSEDFPYLERFGDRTMDVSEPLAAILEVAYTGDGQLTSMRHELLRAIAVTRGEQADECTDHRILKTLVQACDVNAFFVQNEDEIVGSASELAVLCGNHWLDCSDAEISNTLQRYGFRTKSVRVDGGEPRKRYVLGGERLREIAIRYLGSNNSGRLAPEAAEVTTA